LPRQNGDIRDYKILGDTMANSAIVQKLWNYCNVLRDDGMSYGDYVEQLTYLLFLKMIDERTKLPYSYEELISRDKASLDIFWLRDESLEESDKLPEPGVLAQEILDDLEGALEQFREIAEDLGEGKETN